MRAVILPNFAECWISVKSLNEHKAVSFNFRHTNNEPQQEFIALLASDLN